MLIPKVQTTVTARPQSWRRGQGAKVTTAFTADRPLLTPKVRKAIKYVVLASVMQRKCILQAKILLEMSWMSSSGLVCKVSTNRNKFSRLETRPRLS